MYPVLKCINPEGFGASIQKYQCSEFERYFISGDVVEAPFFETVPIGQWQPPVGFPECCPFHRWVLSLSIGLMDKFPNCCTPHKRLAKEPWFNKRNYEGLPAKLLNTLSHTEYHILNRIEREDWYKDITDYIEYCISSFGRFPNGYGNPLGLFTYIDGLTHNIKVNADILPGKKKQLLKYIEHYFDKEKGDGETNFILLLETYSKWIRTFPFEISIFSHLKEKFKKELPFLKNEPVKNPYTGYARGKLKSKEELVSLLVSKTEKILSQINTLFLFENGKLSSIKKVELELILEGRRLELKSVGEKEIDERAKYKKVLNEWFEGEVRFVNSIRPFLQEEENDRSKTQKTKSEAFYSELNNHGFFDLPKTKVLNETKRIELSNKLLTNKIPYSIAMFSFLGFIEHLEKVHFRAKYRMYKEISKWFGGDKEGRNVKANISTLIKGSREDKIRYTAHTYKKIVEKDYQILK